MTSVISKALFIESKAGAVDIVGARLLGVEPDAQHPLSDKASLLVAEAE